MISKDLAALSLIAGTFLLFASRACLLSGEYGFARVLSFVFRPVQRSEHPILYWSLVGLNFGMGMVGVGLALGFVVAKPF